MKNLLVEDETEAENPNYELYCFTNLTPAYGLSKVRWWSRRTGTHLLLWEHTEITTSCWTTINRRMLDPNKKKKIRCIQEQRRSPNKMVGREQSHLKSNLIPLRDARRAQTKACVHQDPGKGATASTREWARPAFESLSVSWGDMTQQKLAVGTGFPAAAHLGGVWHNSYWWGSLFAPLWNHLADDPHTGE